MTITEDSKKLREGRVLAFSASTPALHTDFYLNESADCPFSLTQHEGKQLANINLRLSPEAVYKLLFHDKNFMPDIYSKNKIDDIVYTEWEKDASSKDSIRKVTYTATLPSKALGPPVSFITEIQSMSSMNKDNLLYVVNTEATNGGIPYGDSFKIYVHYCITKLKSEEANVPYTNFSYYASVKFKKSPFFLIKNLIEKSSFEGCESVCQDIISKLKSEADQVHGVVSDHSRLDKKHIKRKRTRLPVTKNASKSILTSIWVWFVISLLGTVLMINCYLYLQINHLEAKTSSQLIQLDMTENESLSNESLLLTLEKLQERRKFVSSYIEEWEHKIRIAHRSIETAKEMIHQIKLTLPQYEQNYMQFLEKEKS